MKKGMSMQWVCAGAWLFMAAVACAQDVKPVTPGGSPASANAPSAVPPASASAPAPASASAPPSTSAAADPAASSQAAASGTKSKSARGTNTAQQEAGEPRAATSATPSAGARPRNKNATDHVELDTTTVTGNRELPKVMYVVPWKRSDIGDLIGRPANSLLDEVLAPVDRSVFRREVQYYQALKPDTATSVGAGGGAAPAPASSGAAAAPEPPASQPVSPGKAAAPEKATPPQGEK